MVALRGGNIRIFKLFSTNLKIKLFISAEHGTNRIIDFPAASISIEKLLRTESKLIYMSPERQFNLFSVKSFVFLDVHVDQRQKTT